MRFDDFLDGRTIKIPAGSRRLRAIAVAAVILFLLGLRRFNGGYTGIDVVFVISGYLMSGVLWRKFRATQRVDVVRFWSRRFRRLLPMSVVVVVVATLAYLFARGEVLQISSAGRGGVYALAYLTFWRELVSNANYFAELKDSNFFVHYWSLAVEEQYYLIISGLAVVLTRVPRRRRSDRAQAPSPSRALVIVGMVSALGFAGSLWILRRNQPQAFFRHLVGSGNSPLARW